MVTSALFVLRCAAQTDVLTWHNDVARTGQNLTESLLTPARVSATRFGLLASVPVEIERNLLCDGHYKLLQFGLGAERNQPDLASWILCSKVSRLIKCARRPRIEHRSQNHFVL